MRALVLLVALGCGPESVADSGGAGGNPHLGGSSGGGSGGAGGIDPGAGGCSDAAKLVYVLDEQNKLSSFRPDTLTFTDIGPLTCPARLGSTPFSMAVDRAAIAWVLYTSGELFHVDTRNAACTPTSFQPGQLGMDVFGMGFASNASGSSDETLFIAGGSLANWQNTAGPVQLGSLAFPAMAVSGISPLGGWAEMTGTGDAKLWAFFGDATPPRVARIDESNGSESQVFSLPQLQTQRAGFAFAFWGGDFWIFFLPPNATTSVYRLRPSDGSLAPMLLDTGRYIVGAGVSTCAPITVG